MRHGESDVLLEEVKGEGEVVGGRRLGWCGEGG